MDAVAGFGDVPEGFALDPVQSVYQKATNAFAAALMRDDEAKAEKFLDVIQALQKAWPETLGSFAARVEKK